LLENAEGLGTGTGLEGIVVLVGLGCIDSGDKVYFDAI